MFLIPITIKIAPKNNRVKRKNNIFKKYIPDEILHNSLKVRIAYVQGILDTSGTTKKTKSAWILKIKDKKYAQQIETNKKLII